MREWISGELLEPAYGPSVALVSTIIYRLVLLTSELVISIVLYASLWRPGFLAASTASQPVGAPCESGQTTPAR
jgi:hypothetical protein